MPSRAAPWSSRAAPWSSRAVAGPCAGQADSTATRGRGASPCEGVSSHRGATADGIQSLPLEEAVVYRRLADHDRDRRMGRPMAPRSATDARPDSVSASEPAVRARPVRRPICMRIEQADGASLLGLRGRVRSVAGEFYSFKASTHRPGCSGLNMVTSARLASGPSRHNLLTRTWVTARNHRRITAPQTRTFNHGAALGAVQSRASTSFRRSPRPPARSYPS